jgi:ferredoxin--NADP+ reductase
MCGGCRVSIGGEMKFACVDGPEFDAHQVDFDELADRLTSYQDQERAAWARLHDEPAGREGLCRGRELEAQQPEGDPEP